MSFENKKIALVIPCYKVKQHILGVLHSIPAFVDFIIVVDDCCPEGTSQYVSENIVDSRIKVIKSEVNQGVGGAVCLGYEEALKRNADIIIKLDGDGQMDPELIIDLIDPIVRNESDYVKGSRFHDPSDLSQMPHLRLFGNAVLSFINKIVTGYWDIMDPTNGFTAISNIALQQIPLKKISKRYFFENDMLFRLSLCKAKVSDFPMQAKYADEISNLKIHRVMFDFPPKYLTRFMKRIFYNYILRDFNFGSISLFMGLTLLTFGATFGVIKYIEYAIIKNVPAPTGMVVIPSLLITLGTQFLISFFHYDISSIPKSSLKTKRKLK